ncbi:UvrD-helicase domain-containing protein [Glycomyces sp. NRRL B-16210]|uniref:HelD family protein n=1 Tax=Glycomyces sp. NRRL B-16210 TaxID=1463821 RepID=UPI000ACA66FC|nr:UvrD-helicase domain-containing protein [Glycomyces sp. NRRL B-16210]
MSQEPGPADDQHPQDVDDTSHAVPDPDPSNTPEQEIAIEQRFVDRVYQRVDVLRADAEGNRDAGYAHLAATVPGAQYERDVFVYRAARRIADLDSQHEGLVFGRLDFDDGKVRHIGRLGVRDEEYRTLLVDWRAPAAAPFYRATAVDRQEVARRRVIRSFGRGVEEISDDLLNEDAAERLPVVGDGALMAALGRKRTGRMRDIVATIQAEQDAAIRAPGRGATIITGGPGTGKTVVALHRAAYLLYQDRNRYEAAGILVVGPSAVFMKYIGRVLPSLGEETAALYSMGELYAGVEATRQDRPEVAAVKGGTVMIPILRRLVRQTPPGAPDELRIVYRGDVFRLDAAELAAVRARVFEKETRPNLAKTEAGRALLIALWRKIKPVIPDAEPAKFSRDVGSRGEFLTFLDHWWPDLDPADVLGWAGDTRRLASAAEGHLKRDAIEGVAASLRESDFSIPDVALLDELRLLLGIKPQPRGRDRIRSWDGIQEVSTTQDRYYDRPERQSRDAFYEDYAHVIVDEAQDLSPMQWRVLGRRGRAAGWTVVGDEAQSSWPRPKESAEARRRAVPRGRVHEFHLTKNYRNSKEVFEYAAEWAKPRLRHIDLPEAVRETGVAVEEKSVAADALLPELAGAVAEALEAVEGTVGIIAPYARHAELAGLVHDDRVTLVGPLESKGLEWDAVIAVDLGAVAKSHGAGVAYVVLTRATQRLHRIDVV